MPPQGGRAGQAGLSSRALLQRRNSDLAAALAATKPKRAPRWTAAERAQLAGHFTGPKHATYAVIAAGMAETFGRSFTAAAVGAQARKLGLVTKPAPKATKAPGKPGKARRAA